jgi:hypothetical protein
MATAMFLARVAVPIHDKYFSENWDCTDFQLKLMGNQATAAKQRRRLLQGALFHI